MRHALAMPSAVRALAVGVVGAAVGARLVPSACSADLFTPSLVAALMRAVPVSPITTATDLELRAAARTTAHPKLVHPTPRADEVSTGGLAEIIIPCETKRFHPRGDSAATESPVSSTSSDDPRPDLPHRPVSGGQIPLYPAIVTIAGPRFTVIASSPESA
jgi:hypothetical protein